MPCRRCTHLKRPCVFSGASTKIAPPPSSTPTAREDDRPSSSAQPPDAIAAELEKRVANLHKIVHHLMGDIKLDPETEQKLADSFDAVTVSAVPPPAPATTRGISQEAVESTAASVEDVKLDDITVQPLENNVTRKEYPNQRGKCFFVTDLAQITLENSLTGIFQ